jgi:hypothetical protein
MSGPLPRLARPETGNGQHRRCAAIYRLRRRPKLLRRVPYCLRHQAALENDPAKVLQMVEAGEGQRADELSGRDQAAQAAWAAWFDCEPQGAGVEGHRGCQPGGRAPLRRNVAGRLRRTARAVRSAGLGPAEYNFPLTLRPDARPEVSDGPDRPVPR